MSNKKELNLDELENVTGGVKNAGRSGYNVNCICTIYYTDDNDVPGVATIEYEIDAYFDLSLADKIARDQANQYCLDHDYNFIRCEVTCSEKYKV